MTKLLTTQNAKTSKGEKKGFLTGILYLAPAKSSGYEVCPKRTKGCTEACLNTAGRGIYKNVQDARLRKTNWFFSDRASFMLQLEKDILTLKRKAEREDFKLVIRLNGTSDIPWWNISYTGADGKRYKNLMEKFRDIQFYDYTKRIVDRRKLPKNYKITFSLAESNELDAKKALKKKMNVAVVFRKPDFPNKYMNRKVIDGDEDDLRFLDPKGVIIGLKAKGKAKKDKTGFVKEVV